MWDKHDNFARKKKVEKGVEFLHYINLYLKQLMTAGELK